MSVKIRITTESHSRMGEANTNEKKIAELEFETDEMHIIKMIFSELARDHLKIEIQTEPSIKHVMNEEIIYLCPACGKGMDPPYKSAADEIALCQKCAAQKYLRENWIILKITNTEKAKRKIFITTA